MSTLKQRLSIVSQPSFDSLDLFHVSHPRWPFPPPASTSTTTTTLNKIHIACFDSSFNPPTRAHFAISMSDYPPRRHASSDDSTSTSTASHSSSSSSSSSSADPYTARLLLLSARNVDKSLKPGDATLDQRIEMMILEADDMFDNGEKNVGVGALNCPTFVGKSEIVLKWLKEVRIPEVHGRNGEGEGVEIELTFLIGTDTLTRLFEPKYYITPSSSTSPTTAMQSSLNTLFTINNCSIVSAHRSSSLSSRLAESQFIESSVECQDRVNRGDIRFLDLGKEEMDMSSTKVRAAVRRGEGVEGLCGKRIAEYVREKGLYKD